MVVEEEFEVPELEMCQKLKEELSVGSKTQGNLVNGNHWVNFCWSSILNKFTKL